ncbi:ATP-grasp domain-containing protein [Streptomyces johnsoniae]|uniref:ATP-grasp domain-containing protein n=1 Tax=Streptomyces johnsoniae TaxID=3075532 RepID=A0ABU2SF66_9ACTN|nr:ATP-grasp domain-containing protein [Streptomyces sp. DSM 41886]MDT0446519.1 ATP-grasp domain-containing protein [Streptomyces sp. DSM 41886]
MEGVEARDGLMLLAGLVDRVVWLDRSGFLPASFGYPAPWLRHEAVSPLLRSAPSPRPAGSAAPPGTRRVAVAFAPEHGDHATAWAEASGHRLLAADAVVTARAADKIDALELFRAAGVAVPEHVVIPARERRRAAAYWRPEWPAAVLQRRENNLLGRGTVPVGGAGELAAALRAWPGRVLKLSRLVPGLSLTVSACVGGDRTVVAAVSHQLVGLPELTPHWGTHCGNQLVGPADLPEGVYERVRRTAHSVGEVLRARGYRGVFGLDLLEDGGDVLAVEVNPRFQTVSALVQAAEHAAGLLPSLGLHILACLLPALPPGRLSRAPVPRPSQLVLHAAGPLEITAPPAAGRYRLDADGVAHGPDPDGPRPPAALRPDEALWWPHAAPGKAGTGDELLLMQFGRPQCGTAPRPPLGTRARTWRDAALRALGVAA